MHLWQYTCTTMVTWNDPPDRDLNPRLCVKRILFCRRERQDRHLKEISTRAGINTRCAYPFQENRQRPNGRGLPMRPATCAPATYKNPSIHPATERHTQITPRRTQPRRLEGQARRENHAPAVGGETDARRQPSRRVREEEQADVQELVGWNMDGKLTFPEGKTSI